MMIGTAVTSGVLAAPMDGKICWTTHADLAAGAAAVLNQEGRFERLTPPVSAREAADLDDVAAVLADLTGRPVERRVIEDQTLANGMAQRGLLPAIAAIAVGLYRAFRAGEFARTHPTLAALIGREPATLRDVLAR